MQKSSLTKEFGPPMRLNSEKSLCESSIDALNKDLKSVNKKIKELIQNDPKLNNRTGGPVKTQ